MKAAFFYDGNFLRSKKNEIFSKGGFPYKIWRRYLAHFECIIVTARCKEIQAGEEGKCVLSSGDNVFFQPVPSINNIMIFKNYKKVRNIIRKVLLQVDCVIIRLPSMTGLAACFECIRMKKHWAVEVVGCAWDALWNHGSIKGKIIAPIMFILNKYFIKKAPYAIYVSKHFLQSRYPCDGFVTDCSDVDISMPQEEVLKKRLDRIDKGFDQRPINFGMIGSLDVAYKGHETAIRALASIKNQIKDFKLLLLGPGNTARWKQLAVSLGIGDNIVFCGTLPGGDPVLKWLDEIDIFLMPSLQEGLPRALVEAMSRGCPAIGARTGGIPELLNEEYIHRPKDIKALVNLIIKLISSKELMKKSAIENFERSKEYSKDVLDNKRNKFWSEFRKYVESKNV